MVVIKTILQRDSELRTLVTSPLMLSIVTLSYRGATTVDLPFDLPKSAFIYSMRKHLFNAYIKRMLIHRAIAKRYSNRSTLQWLVWLARNMSRHQQSILQVKNLDPTWLEEERLSTSVFVSSLSLLLWVPLGMIYVYFVQSSAPELITGLAVGLSLGLGELRHLLKDSPLSDRLSSLWPIDWRKIDVRSMLGWIFWLWVVQNFLSVALVALLSGLISTLLNKLMPETIQIGKMSTPDDSKQSPQQTAIRMVARELVGALTGVLVALLYYLINGGLPARLTDTLVSGMMFGLLVGVQASGASIIRLCFQRIVNVILRPYLWIYKYGPFNYTRFLDYCHDRIFLRKVGGGYIFVHRMLLEHFASLTDDNIKRLAAEVEASRS